MKKIILTCLLVGTMVMMMCMSVFAAYNYPEFSSQKGNYVILYNSSDDIYYAYDYNSEYFKISVTSNGELSASLVGNQSYQVQMYSYVLDTSSNTWKSKDSYGASSLVSIGSGFDIVYSTKDIYDSSNNLVFPLPPTPSLMEMLGMSLEEMSLKVVGVMKILALCGVGCLALLTGLKLFGKVLPIFRV